jgi:hypothetical protein
MDDAPTLATLKMGACGTRRASSPTGYLAREGELVLFLGKERSLRLQWKLANLRLQWANSEGTPIVPTSGFAGRKAGEE